MLTTSCHKHHRLFPTLRHAFGFVFAASFVLSVMASYPVTAQEKPDKTVKVFIMAGQSNMAGHGVVDLDDPNDYNHGQGNLNDVIANAKNPAQFAHLKDPDGKWVARDDVWIWYQTPRELKANRLTVGFTGYQGEPHHFGPELQLGHVLGDAFSEPVLLIKTAWGGKSLYEDFRPPGAGGEVGPYYIQMLEQIGEAMENAPRRFRALQNHQPEISGFVWQQGWNDMINDDATAEYESNLLNFIRDVRQQLDCPELPFVIGELGNGGSENVGEKMLAFRKAQAAVAKHEDRNVAFVPTAQFARPPEQSPNVKHLHHWFGNAESYFLVGDALGKRMLRLIQEKERPRVLILGDSISIGYTPYVKKILADEAVVVRPMMDERRPENCAGTDKGIENIDRWLMIDGGHWDVIHFNWGLHDLKHVDAKSGQNSNRPEDPLQSPPEDYERQLREIVGKLRQTNAKLICGLTTPVPAGSSPLREPASPPIYNAIAKKIAQENGIEINDLFRFANERKEEMQRPANVHFTPAGSQALAEQVASKIRESLNSESAPK